MHDYHDREWGVPEHDSRALWEKLILDGFQAGLSWSIILRKREAFRTAFEGFDPERIACYGDDEVARLLNNPGIVRSRAKIEATINNARAYLSAQDAGEDLSIWVWAQVGGQPIQGGENIPTKTVLSEHISRALKLRGYKFVGPVIVYAWMQACGLVNDHEPHCFCRTAI